MVTGIKMADPDAVDVDGDADPVVTTNMDAYATVSAYRSGSATVMLGGNDMTENSMMRVAPDKVVLNLTLTAKGPLDVLASIMAEVTFTGDYFTKVFTDAHA